MTVLCVADDAHLENMIGQVRKCLQEGSIYGLNNYSEAPPWLEVHPSDAVLFYAKNSEDIHSLKDLRSAHPYLPILLVADDPSFSFEALQLHVTGYLLYPIIDEALRLELEYIRSKEAVSSGQITIRTGNQFEIFGINGKPVHFRRTPAKKILEILIAQNGCGLSAEELCFAIWGEDNYTKRDYLKKAFGELNRVLRENRASDVLIRTGYRYSVDLSKITIE